MQMSIWRNVHMLDLENQKRIQKSLKNTELSMSLEKKSSHSFMKRYVVLLVHREVLLGLRKTDFTDIWM